MTNTDSAFLYHGGDYTGPLEMRYSIYYDNGDNPRPFVTHLGKTILTANGAQANAYLLTIAEALYGQDALTMETAERLSYLAGSVLADNEVPLPEPEYDDTDERGEDYEAQR